MLWTEVQSELEIDHSIASVIVGGAVPNLMINTVVRSGRHSMMFLNDGPFATLEQARARAEAMAAEHGIDKIYRVLPLRRG